MLLVPGLKSRSREPSGFSLAIFDRAAGHGVSPQPVPSEVNDPPTRNFPSGCTAMTLMLVPVADGRCKLSGSSVCACAPLAANTFKRARTRTAGFQGHRFICKRGVYARNDEFRALLPDGRIEAQPVDQQSV